MCIVLSDSCENIKIYFKDLVYMNSPCLQTLVPITGSANQIQNCFNPPVKMPTTPCGIYDAQIAPYVYLRLLTGCPSIVQVNLIVNIRGLLLSPWGSCSLLAVYFSGCVLRELSLSQHSLGQPGTAGVVWMGRNGKTHSECRPLYQFSSSMLFNGQRYTWFPIRLEASFFFRK